MKAAYMRWLTGCVLGLPLLASAQPPPHEHDHADVATEGTGFRPLQRRTRADSARAAGSGGVSTTLDNQILLELAPEDTTTASLFDLNGLTLIFTPDGHGGYSRLVQSVAWEDDIGRAVADGEEIGLQSFMFDFASQRWGSFFVSQRGVITFGEPLTYSYSFGAHDTLSEIAAEFVATPAIAVLYKPLLGGRYDRYGATQHVAASSDEVVVTWITTEPEYYVHGVPPTKSSRFQVVLKADGRIAFNFGDVALSDGIVGLFQDQLAKGDLIASVADPTDSQLPGYLDLLEAAVYESNAVGVILEFRTREPIPDPPDNSRYSYRLYFDTDRPYWTEYGDGSDMDFAWVIDVRAGGERVARTFNGHDVRLLESGAGNLLALLARIGEPDGISATVIAGAGEHADRWVRGDNSRPVYIELPNARHDVDLSRPSAEYSRSPREVFHYRGPPDLEELACRVIDYFGDRFDVVVFHHQFRVDKQDRYVSGKTYEHGIEGLGTRVKRPVPCGAHRLRRTWEYPSWIYGLDPEDLGPELATFAHEFMHAWTAWLSYDRQGERARLFGMPGNSSHWRPDLHTPAIYPWRGAEAQSIMGSGSGRYWRDNGDGTYTSVDNYRGSGPSWLDLYAMGLAGVDEVPDMFILRNLESIDGQGICRGGRYCNGAVWRADKEMVSIEQIVAADGPRVPSAQDAQKDFNAAFVYLLEPGQPPDPDMLRLHAEYRNQVVEHWGHITGGRSQLTTTVRGAANRSPVAVGALADRAVGVGGGVVVDAGGAFRDPDGDPLTYGATSSSPSVASVEVSGSTVAVRAVAAGSARIAVTATDIGGSNTTATLGFRVTVRGVGLTTFTDDPILPGMTPIRAVHFTELRERIDLLRDGVGLAPFGWTDPVLTAGVTPVKLAHLLELRAALAAAYRASGRAGPVFTGPAPMSGRTPIGAVHLMELRAAVVALE